MNLKYIPFVCCLLFSSQIYASKEVIAVDGLSGFVGASLARDFKDTNLKLGCHQCVERLDIEPQILVGSIYDPVYLRTFLKDVTIYYQVAAISSVIPKNSLEEYILTNSIGPYLASRINKSMTMVGLSTIAIRDIEQDQSINNWVGKFTQHFADIDYESSNLSGKYLIKNLANFMTLYPPPQLQPKQYYGLSKLLLENLLRKSAQTRSGNIYLIRPAVVIGDDIKQRRGNSVVKNIMDAIFLEQNKYEVWNRQNCFIPITKLKQMMSYVVNTRGIFAKFETFDAGCVVMNQHAFVNKILNKISYKGDHIVMVSHSDFERDIVMLKDERLSKYYPNVADIDDAIEDMISKYKENDQSILH
jgi:hypothetical protein